MMRKKSDQKVNFEIGKGFALVSQIAISFLMPVLFSLWLTRGLVRRWNLGNGYIVLGLLLGIAVGMSSVYHLIVRMYDLGKKKKFLENLDFEDLNIKRIDSRTGNRSSEKKDEK